MKSTLVGSLAALAGSASALKEIVNPAKLEKYTSGAVMDSIMESKYQTWDSQRATGAMDAAQYPSFRAAGSVPCVDGVAEVVPGDAMNTFKCLNVSGWVPKLL